MSGISAAGLIEIRANIWEFREKGHQIATSVLLLKI
jgi:hypothetical protein